VKRSWGLRLLLYLWLAYVAVGLFFHPEFSGIFQGINWGAHELGHYVVKPFTRTDWIRAAAGTVGQNVPILASFYFFMKQRDYFALSISSVWLGASLGHTGSYIASSLDDEVWTLKPVWAPEVEVYHDFNIILDRFGVLEQCKGIGQAVKILSRIPLVAGLLWGAWVLWLMFTQRNGTEGRTVVEESGGDS